LVVDPTEPRVVDTATVPPDDVNVLLWASFSVTVIVDVDVPLAVIDADEAVTTEVVVDADPGFTVKLADADDVVTVDALTVPEAAMT
jgi:hypothetical protein